jgi:hypothetical protein
MTPIVAKICVSVRKYNINTKWWTIYNKYIIQYYYTLKMQCIDSTYNNVKDIPRNEIGRYS